jgi:hypothetical protein
MTRFLTCLMLATFLGGCGSSPATSAPPGKPSGFAALSGKRISGTSPDWIPIASPFNHPANVSTTITPPVETDGMGADGSQEVVSFFDFGSAAAASAFYAGPPLGARLASPGILAYQPLVGNAGIPLPSRGLDLRSCLWAGGPNQGGTAGRGTPSGGELLPSGQCSIGTSSSIGVATIFRRGSVVVIVEVIDTTVIGGAASPSELQQNVPLALSALNLMHSVELA